MKGGCLPFPPNPVAISFPHKADATRLARGADAESAHHRQAGLPPNEQEQLDTIEALNPDFTKLEWGFLGYYDDLHPALTKLGSKGGAPTVPKLGPKHVYFANVQRALCNVQQACARCGHTPMRPPNGVGAFGGKELWLRCVTGVTGSVTQCGFCGHDPERTSSEAKEKAERKRQREETEAKAEESRRKHLKSASEQREIALRIESQREEEKVVIAARKEERRQFLTQALVECPEYTGAVANLRRAMESWWHALITDLDENWAFSHRGLTESFGWHRIATDEDAARKRIAEDVRNFVAQQQRSSFQSLVEEIVSRSEEYRQVVRQTRMRLEEEYRQVPFERRGSFEDFKKKICYDLARLPKVFMTRWFLG